MVKCLFRGHGASSEAAEVAESAAAGGEEDRGESHRDLHPRGTARRPSARYRQGGVRRRRDEGFADEVAGHDEHFLVRDGDRQSAAERVQRWDESRRAGSADEQEVDAVEASGVVERDAEGLGGVGCGIEGRCAGVGEVVARAKASHLLCEEADIAACGEDGDFKAVGIAGDDVECLATN